MIGYKVNVIDIKVTVPQIFLRSFQIYIEGAFTCAAKIKTVRARRTANDHPAPFFKIISVCCGRAIINNARFNIYYYTLMAGRSAPPFDKTIITRQNLHHPCTLPVFWS